MDTILKTQMMKKNLLPLLRTTAFLRRGKCITYNLIKQTFKQIFLQFMDQS